MAERTYEQAASTKARYIELVRDGPLLAVVTDDEIWAAWESLSAKYGRASAMDVTKALNYGFRPSLDADHG